MHKLLKLFLLVLDYHTFALDANGDSRSYMTLYALPSWLQQGKSLHLKITAVPENSNAWFMIFKSKDALQYLQKRINYEAALRVSCVRKEGLLDVQLEAPLYYQHQTLLLGVNDISQKMAGKLNDSTILYHAKFNLRKMAKDALVLKVFKNDLFLFSTDTLFADPDKSI